MLTRRQVGYPWLRGGGWLISVLGVTTLAALATPRLSPGPVIGTGGYLGAMGKTLLQTQFASVGTYIVSVSMILGGLLLSTDYALVRLLILGLDEADPRLWAAACCRWARPTPKNSISGDPTLTILTPPGMAVRAAVRLSGRPADAETRADAASQPRTRRKTKTSRTKRRLLAGIGRRSLRIGLSRPKRHEPEPVLEEMDESDLGQTVSDYELPSMDLLLAGETVSYDEQEKEVRRKAKVLEKTFLDFGFNIRVVENQNRPGHCPVRGGIGGRPALSRITGLADDLAIALRMPQAVRIVAPRCRARTRSALKCPTNQRQIILLREVMEEANGKAQKFAIPIYLGKDVAGTFLIVDLTTLPHLLIAGRTGTGKSVCLNSIIISMLMTPPARTTSAC